MVCKIPHSTDGRLETMVYDGENIELSNAEINEYKKFCIDKIYGVLCVFEDCEGAGDFESYRSYIKRINKEFIGAEKILGMKRFTSVVCSLNGLLADEFPKKEDVKPIVFYCIATIKKTKVG